jgi:hypothetical protein
MYVVICTMIKVTEDFHPGDGLVFESMRAHRISPVTAGTRKVEQSPDSIFFFFFLLYIHVYIYWTLVYSFNVCVPLD